MPQNLIDSNNFKQLLLRAVYLPLIVALLMAGILLAEIMRLRYAAQWESRTEQVISEARKARRLIADFESGQLSYLLTRDSAFLATADEQEKAVNQELDYLSRLVADNPEQQQRLQVIRYTTAQLLTEARDQRDLRAQGGDYLARVRAGNDLINQLDSEYEGFSTAEDSQRAEREEAPRAMTRNIIATAYGLIIILAVVLVLSVRSQMQSLSISYERARRLAEERTEALRNHEQWLTTTLRSIGDAVIATDREEHITFMNSVAESMTGWAQQEVIGKDIDEALRIVDVETRARKHSAVAQALAFGSTVGLGNYALLISRTGNEIVIDNRSTPIRDRGGNVHGAVLVFHDVTESQRSEQALRESEARYRFLADAMPQIVWTARPDGSIDYFNQRWFEYTGLSEEDSYTDIGWTLALHPDDLKIFLAQWAKTMRAGKAFDREFRLKQASDETYRWHLARVVPCLDEAGKITRWFGACTDIDDQKRAEETLRESEERFHAMADSAPVFLWLADTEGRRYFFNKPWLDFTGRPLEQQIDGGWLSDAHPDDLASCQEVYLSAVRARQTFEMEFRLRRADGEYRWLLDRGVPRFTPGGEFAGYIGSCLDITDRKLLEAQLIQSQKMEGIGRLAGGMAHDFNNLLTAIMGYAELAETRNLTDPQLAEDIQSIQQAGERAATLTRQLLAFARRQIVAPRVLNLNELLANVERLLHRLIGEDITLETQLQPALPCIKADQGQLEQVLVNMAVNARDAMPNGGRLLLSTEVVTLDESHARQVANVSPGDYVRLSIADTGTGMTEEVKAHLFEPFFTTKEGSKGTGLGLATCYGIIRQSGGHITVDSQLGQGTTFRIYLPAVEEQAEPIVVSEAPENAPLGTETVLLVEDEAVVRDLAARVLKTQGYRVLEAANGEEALRVAEEYNGKPIHLLLSDVVMPQMGGGELANRLRAQRPDMMVLLASGYTDDALIHHTIREAEVAFLPKPFTPIELAHKVREVLDHDPQ